MATASLNPFHLAIPVYDLDATRQSYCERLGCKVGREAPRWIDFNFFGHQVSVHLVDENPTEIATNAVDGDKVPSRHFGVVLEWNHWKELGDKLQSLGQEFLIAPRVRFEGKPGEQGTFFIYDPAGNALEFKTFKQPEQLFATD